MEATHNNTANAMGLNLMDSATLERYLRTLNSASGTGLQFPVMPPLGSTSSTSNTSLTSPLTTIPLLPFVTGPNLILDFAAMQQQQQQQQIIASKKQQEEERQTIEKNIQSWDRQNGWKLSKIKTNEEATADAKKLFSVILRTRSEKNMIEMPDRLYSSLKYEILIKLSRLFVKYELSSNTDLIFCRIEIVSSSDPNGSEILKDGEKLMKGIQDMTTMSVSKDKSAFETKLKFQYTTNSYNMDGQVFIMRIQFYDPSVSIETPLMVVHSTKFQIFARRPTMRQQGEEVEAEEGTEENQQDSAKKKTKAKPKSKKKKTSSTSKKSSSSPKKAVRRSARLKARESDEEDEEELEDEELEDQVPSEDENEEQISDSEKKESPKKKAKTNGDKIIEIPDSPMVDPKSDNTKLSINQTTSSSSSNDTKESTTATCIKEEKINTEDTKLESNATNTTTTTTTAITSTTSSSQNSISTPKQTTPVSTLMNTAALLGLLQPSLFPGLPMNGLQSFTNCLQLLIQLKNTLPESEQSKAMQMIQEKLFNNPTSTLNENDFKSLFK